MVRLSVFSVAFFLLSSVTFIVTVGGLPTNPTITFAIRQDIDCGPDCRTPDTHRGNSLLDPEGNPGSLSCLSTDYPCPLLDASDKNCTLRSLGIVQPFFQEVLDFLPRSNDFANSHTSVLVSPNDQLFGDYLYVNLNVGLCEHTVPIRYSNPHWNNLLVSERIWYQLNLGFGTHYWHINGNRWRDRYLPYIHSGVSPRSAYSDPPTTPDGRSALVHVVEIPLVNPPFGTFVTTGNFLITRFVQLEFRGEVNSTDWDDFTFEEVCTPYNDNLSPYFFDVTSAEAVFMETVIFRDLCISNPIARFSVEDFGDLGTLTYHTQGMGAYWSRFVNIASVSTPLFETVNMKNIAIRYIAWTGVQFPSNLQSRAFWDLLFTDTFVDCVRNGQYRDCGVALQNAAFVCIGVGTRSDGPSTTLRGIEPDGVGQGRVLVPSLMNWRNPRDDSNWILASTLWRWVHDTKYNDKAVSQPLTSYPYEPFPSLWHLELLTTRVFPYIQGFDFNSFQSYVNFSECDPAHDWPGQFVSWFNNPSPAPRTNFVAQATNLTLSWAQGARTVDSPLDIWCEPPLYQFNTTHNYLRGNSTVCVSCPLPYINRHPTRPERLLLRTHSDPAQADPTQFQFLETCSDVCPPGFAPNYFRTGCEPCPETAFSFGGTCVTCPSVNGPGLRGISGDVCTCDPGYIFQPIPPVGSGTLSSEPAPSCVVCPKDTEVNSVTNLCEACPIGQGRASSDAGSPQALECSACPELEYNPDGGPKGCRSCPEGAVNAPLSSLDGDLAAYDRRITCQCSPGFFFNASGGPGGRGSCDQCPRRTYNPASPENTTLGDFAACAVCPLGTAPNADHTECDPCTSQEHPLEPGVCYKCGMGQEYAVDFGQCLPCPAGYISGLGEPCRGCGLGQTSDASHGSCIDCPAGTFSASEGPCIPCPPGLVPDPSQVGCVCPEGFQLDPETNLCAYSG